MSVMIVMPHTTVLRGTDSNGPTYAPMKSYAILFDPPEARHARFLGLVAGLGLRHIAEGSPLSNQGMPKT